MPVCSSLAAHTHGSGHKRIFREDRFVYLWVTVKRMSGSCQENRFTADYASFRQRLDAVLRTLDVKQVRGFLIAKRQWSPGTPADPEFAMWMVATQCRLVYTFSLITHFAR